MWTPEGVQTLGSTAPDVWGLNMEDTGKAVAQAWGEEPAEEDGGGSGCLG